MAPGGAMGAPPPSCVVGRLRERCGNQVSGAWFMVSRSSCTGASPPGPSGVKRPSDDSSKTMVFLLREQMGFAKSMVFIVAGTKGASGDSSKTMVVVSVAGSHGCFKNNEEYAISGQMVVGAVRIIFLGCGSWVKRMLATSLRRQAKPFLGTRSGNSL